MAKKIQEIGKYETDSCYRLSDEYLNNAYNLNQSGIYRPEEGNRDIGAGSWILINKVPDIDPDAKPEPASLYYALPAIYGTSVGYRDDGSYLVKIKVQGKAVIHDVYLYTHEYIVIGDELWDELHKEDMLELVEYNVEPQKEKGTDTAIIKSWRDKYANMHEDERNTVDAYMLDGLSFDQASSMYFTERYSSLQGSAFYYKAKPELRYLFWS